MSHDVPYHRMNNDLNFYRIRSDMKQASRQSNLIRRALVTVISSNCLSTSIYRRLSVNTPQSIQSFLLFWNNTQSPVLRKDNISSNTTRLLGKDPLGYNLNPSPQFKCILRLLRNPNTNSEEFMLYVGFSFVSNTTDSEEEFVPETNFVVLIDDDDDDR